jgi:hypothetical protein
MVGLARAGGVRRRVNVLVPNGYIRMTETVPEDHRPYTEAEMPPKKVAPLVAFLASEDAAGITGCTLSAGGDRVGVYTDHTVEAVGIEPEGWSLQSLRAHFREDVAADASLSRTDRYLQTALPGRQGADRRAGGGVRARGGERHLLSLIRPFAIVCDSSATTTTNSDCSQTTAPA